MSDLTCILCICISWDEFLEMSMQVGRQHMVNSNETYRAVHVHSWESGNTLSTLCLYTGKIKSGDT